MGEQRGLFGGLLAPTKIKTGAPEIDDAQSELLTRLAGGDISGSLSGGEKLIALGALLKSVSRGSKTSPQEVLQNLQQSKLQEMQTKIQLQQIKSEAEKKRRIGDIIGTGQGAPGGAQGVNDPEYYYSIADQLAQAGDTSLADAYRKQGDSIAQYTGGGKLTTAYAAKIVDDAFSMVKGIDPTTQRPVELPRWQASGYPNAMAYIQANTPGALMASGQAAAPAPEQGAEPTIPTQVGGRTVNVPVMSPPLGGIGQTGLSEQEKARLQVDSDTYKALRSDAMTRALAAERRLPQTQALGALSQALATGKTAEFRNAAASWLDAFGLSNDPRAKAALANAAAFNDLRKQVTLANLQSLAGPSSDRDVVFSGGIGPMMDNSPAGNQLITATQVALDRREIAFNNFLGRYEGPMGTALEAWRKTRQGRLGILGDPEYIKAAAKTGLLKTGVVKDKSGRNRLFVLPRGKPLSQAIYLN
jgi:hypothetical protein